MRGLRPGLNACTLATPSRSCDLAPDMETLGPEMLPLPQRLALSYTPAPAREDVLTLMLLDNRLAGILRQRGEVMIAQIKLAWWRDRLGESSAAWPGGEPLLARLATGQVDPAHYAGLVDGWEALLAEDFGQGAMEEFIRGRAQAWSALAHAHRATDADGVMQAARQWSLVDLALNLGQGEEAEAAFSLARAQSSPLRRLPASARALAVLHGLSRRTLRRNGADLIDGPGAALLALRIGLTGR